jgi:CheY-like chemotaxis protein
MARFPRTEAQILALANNLAAGLTANALIFATPPLAPADLTIQIDGYNTALAALAAAQAAAKQATIDKDDALDALVASMRSDLDYATTTVHGDDAQLALLGWGGNAAPTALAAPGQPRMLEAAQQGDDWILLDWKAPSDGGAVAAYKVQRRERPAGAYLDVGMAVDSEITLTAQERGKDWEYRIVAINKAGESPASNTVAAVL